MAQKALFVCGVAGRYRFTYAVSREAEERFDIRPYYLVFNTGMVKYLQEKGVEQEQIIYLKPDIEKRLGDHRPADIEKLKSIEKSYGIPNLMLFWEGIRVHEDGYSHEEALKRMEALFTVTVELFSRYRFDFALLDTIVSNMQMMFLLTVFEKNGRPFYYLFPSKIPNRFVISRGLEDRHRLVEKCFEEIRQRDLTGEERGMAEAFLNVFRGGRDVLLRESDKKFKGRRLFDYEMFKKGIRALWEGYRFKTYKGGIRKHTVLEPLEYVGYRFFHDVRGRLYRRLPLFEAPDYSGKYVVFFLHKQPEASTFVKAPFFLNQHAVIENIAKSLPVDVMLYIKPHYNAFGAKPLRYYREFLCRPNIKFVKVDANAKELIRHSKGVVTITGTVGWEGLLLGKPVISMGNMFYNMYDQVIRVTDPTLLPEKIDFALSRYVADDELLKKFIAALFNGSHEGLLIPPRMSEKSLVPENIKRIVDGMAAEGVFGPAD